LPDDLGSPSLPPHTEWHQQVRPGSEEGLEILSTLRGFIVLVGYLPALEV